jgi:hypothetical protein
MAERRDGSGQEGRRDCPDEWEFLGYVENTLAQSRRAEVDNHLCGCGDCREFLVLYGTLVRESAETPAAGVTVDESDVRSQADRIAGWINSKADNKDVT